MRGGSASASGGSSDNFGVFNEEGSDTELHGVSVTATAGSTSAYGVYQLVGGAASYTCVHAYDGSFGALGTACT